MPMGYFFEIFSNYFEDLKDAIENNIQASEKMLRKLIWRFLLRRKSKTKVSPQQKDGAGGDQCCSSTNNEHGLSDELITNLFPYEDDRYCSSLHNTFRRLSFLLSENSDVEPAAIEEIDEKAKEFFANETIKDESLIQAMEKAMRANGIFDFQLGVSTPRTCKRIKELLEIDSMDMMIRDMEQNVISEVRSYTNPPQAVHDVMVCVYLLLGVEDESKLQTWKSIKSLLNMTGKESLKMLIRRRLPEEISENVVNMVRIKMSGYRFKQIFDNSEGAAVFYLWMAHLLVQREKLKVEK